MKAKVIVINPKDNVAVALEDLHAGDRVTLPDGSGLTVAGDVPAGHKVALREISAGCEVVKYGENIGNAVETIRRGEWVHTHNLDIRGGEAR
jgi:predicted RecA/RadA family phage recombinase